MRVCGGQLRGRRLAPVVGGATRPTSQRAREGLYDWLGPRVVGCRVLDLFAGTGALGIEAISRGAHGAVFVETDRRALRALRRNCRDLALEDRSRILAFAALPALARLREEGQRFDLTLADPPYQGDDWARLAVCDDLVNILAAEAIVLVERARRSERAAAVPGLIWQSCKNYGETAFDWYERAPEGGDGA